MKKGQEAPRESHTQGISTNDTFDSGIGLLSSISSTFAVTFGTESSQLLGQTTNTTVEDDGAPSYQQPEQVAHPLPLVGLTNSRVVMPPEYTTLCLFMQHYTAHSLFDYLPDLYRFEPVFADSMNKAISVPAMALVSYQTKDAALLRLAHTKYAEAVKRT